MKRKTGLTLVETILAIGLTAVAITASLIAYYKVSTAQTINKEVKNLNQMFENMKNIYMPQKIDILITGWLLILN